MAERILKCLGESIGLSPTAYVKLLAETHEILGHGHLPFWRARALMSDSRWGEPDYTVQLAIAHVHEVPWPEVLRMGWPHWLRLATDDVTTLTAPWTVEGTADTLRHTQRTTKHPDSHLAVTGPALSYFTRQTLDVVAGPSPSPARDGHAVSPGTVALIEARVDALEKMLLAINPVTAYRVARAELGLTTKLLTEGGYDRHTGTRLLIAASNIACLCGDIKDSLGDYVLTEWYYMASARAAASAGSPSQTSSSLADVALLHTYAGDPRDALLLVEAAKGITQHPSPRLAAVLHTREARAHARLKDSTATMRALDQAADALAADTADDSTPGFSNVDQEWLSRVTGRAWLDLRRPKRALEHLTTLLDEASLSNSPTQPLIYTARSLLTVVTAQLSLGDIDAAVHSAHRATDLFDSMPVGLARQYGQRFLPHHQIPAVRNLLDRLNETHADFGC
ncbi:hypothetical protein AB0K71_18110 [Streptomyces syringium]|uniref:hypothetical protein n=1 Tax=Streptomyces syringium TaxID=76729 RepID=UPI00342A9E00